MTGRIENIVEAKSLCKSFGGKLAVDHVNMTVRKGDIYGLIEKNGTGKTTFIRIVCGLAVPTDGSLKLFGSDNLEQQRYKMGCTIENPALYPAMTAQENTEVYRIALGIQDQQIIPDLMEFVGLHELGRKKTKDSSLGMKQRLMIAIALLGRPELLILDEPMNGLDPTGIIEVRELLLKLNRERHLTIIISSHILEELSKIATHYGVIHKGKMADEFTAAELEQRCRKELKFLVSDPQAAAHLIQEAVTDHFGISSGNEIILHDCLDQAGRINRLLLESSVEVSAIIPGEQGLEDYFTNLIGERTA